MKIKRVISAAALALVCIFGAAPVRAENPEHACQEEEALGECFNRLMNEMPNQKELEEAETAAKDEGLSKNDAAFALEDIGTLGNGALRSFLQTFLAQVDGVSTSSQEGNLTLTYNSPGQNLSAVATLHQAAVSDMVLEKYPEDQREAKKEALTKELDDLSDIEVKFVFNFQGTRRGRSLAGYRDLYEKLVKEAIQPSKAELRGALDELHPYMGSLADTKIRDLPPATRTKVEGIVKRAAALMQEAGAQFKLDVEQGRLLDFHKLVANQQQLFLEVGGRTRDELMGPDTWSAKLVWEMPAGRNLNKWRDYCRDVLATGPTLACFKDYLDQDETDNDLRPKDRWKLELDASQVQEYEFKDPVSGELLIDTDSDLKATLAGSYTRVLRYVTIKDPVSGEPVEVEASRLDANISGEYVDNEEIFQRRFVLSLTLTNRLTDTFDAALSFVYASDPAQRGDVDKAFSANAGLRLKVGRTGS